ncbi:unnamed protein product, partial [marine sediment metagenome]
RAIAPTQPKPNGGTMEKIDKEVDYFEYWHKPTVTFPTGAFAIMVGRNTVLYNGPYPIEQYPHKDLPITPTDPVSLLGIATGSVPRISQARPLQREYNAIRSKIWDNSDALGNSVIMASRSANLEVKKITNLTANIIQYDGPFKPNREPGVPISNGLFAHLATISDDIDDIFAFHTVSKGKMPKGGPRSAKGLDVLQSGDTVQMGPMLNGLQAADRRIIHQAITLGLANYKGRLLPIVGDDYQWTLHQMDTNELNGKINTIVKENSTRPLDKERSADRAFMIWQSGLLGSPDDPGVRQRTIKQMGLGNIENIMQTNSKHIQFARREYIAAEKGVQNMPPINPNASVDQIEAHLMQYVQMPGVNTFDDHLIHRQEHIEFVLDKQWEYVNTGAPQYILLLQGMIAHLEMHDAAISEATMRSMQTQSQFEAFVKGNTIPQLLIKRLAAQQEPEDKKAG